MTVTMPRNRQRTRAELIDLTRRMIDVTGQTRFTVAEICAAGGYTRGALYSSFSGVDELLIAVYGQQNEDLIELVAAAIKGMRQAAERGLSLEEIVDSLVPALEVDRGRLALQASLTALALHDPALAELVAEHRRSLRHGLEPHLCSLAELAGRKLATDRTTFTRAVMAAYAGAAADAVAPSEYDDLRSLLLRTTIGGLTTVAVH